MSLLRSTTGSTGGMAVLIALGVSASLALGGCSLLPSVPAPAPTSDDSSSAQPEQSEAESTEETDEVPAEQQTMPANFPDEIPVPDLDILIVVDLGTGWTIGYTTDDAVAAFNDLADRYSAESWEELSREATADQGFAAFDSTEYQVQLNAATDNTGFDTPVLTITVVRKN